MHAAGQQGIVARQVDALFHVSAHPIPVRQFLQTYALVREHHALLCQFALALTHGTDSVAHLLDDRRRLVPLGPGRYRPEMVLLEAIFERVRDHVQAEAPSRLEIVFAWSNRSFAERFCAEYFPHGLIYRCALIEGMAVERDGALVVAAFDALMQPGP